MEKKPRMVKLIKRKGFPTSSKYYKEAHAEADNAEKKANSKEYKAMKKIDSKLSKHELVGKNLRSGIIEVSDKVPKKYRKGVALHEEKELQAIKRLEKLHGRKSVKRTK